MDNTLALDAPWLKCTVQRQPYRPTKNPQVLQFQVILFDSITRPLTVIFDPRKTSMSMEDWKAKLRVCVKDAALRIKGDYLVRPYKSKEGAVNVGLKISMNDVEVTGEETAEADDEFAVEDEFVQEGDKEADLVVKAYQLSKEADKNLSQVQDKNLINLANRLKRPRGEDKPSGTSEASSESGSTSGFVATVSASSNRGSIQDPVRASSTSPEGMPAAPLSLPPGPPPAGLPTGSKTNASSKTSGGFSPSQLNQNTKKVFTETKTGGKSGNESNRMDTS